MPREDWDRIQEIFLKAVDLPPAERVAFLDRACKSNTEVRREVESLLRADGTNEAVVFAAIESEAASMLDEPSLVGARLTLSRAQGDRARRYRRGLPGSAR